MIVWSSLGLVMLGSAVGGVCRYLLADLINHFVRGFPLGTLTINVVGSFMMGLCLVLVMHSSHRLLLETLLMVGLLGGFTTFSSFSLETLSLMKEGRILAVVIYVILSVMISLQATFWGVKIMQWVL